MSSAKEIITLQFGHYANFVGTHFWNIQTSSLEHINASDKKSRENKEINYDIIFREGKTFTNETTYTPRTIFYDLKNSLNTLKSDGTLYDCKSSDDEVTWSTGATLHVLSSAHKNEFIKFKEIENTNSYGKYSLHRNDEHLNDTDMDEIGKVETKNHTAKQSKISRKRRFDLDDQINVWSDYLKSHLHPKTINLITTESHENADAFDLFALGTEAYMKQKYEIEDRLHFFVEECDNLQGFHILIDAYNAFSGLSASVFEDYLYEEFPNKGFLMVNTFPSHAKKNSDVLLKSLMNMLLCYDSFSSSSAILPLSTEQSVSSKNTSSVSFPYLNYKANLPYHSSAILAIALDQLSLKYRSYGCDVLLKNYFNSITLERNKFLTSGLSLPFTLNDSLMSLFQLSQSGVDKTVDCHSSSNSTFNFLTPSLLNENLRILSQNVIFSGLTDEQIYGLNVDSLKLARYSNKYDLLNDFVLKSFNCRSNFIEISQNPIRIDEPFPHIFSPYLNQNGLLTSKDLSDDGYVNSTPSAFILQNNSSIVGHLETIETTIGKLPKQKLKRVLGDSLEEDDFLDKLEHFRSFKENYS